MDERTGEREKKEIPYGLDSFIRNHPVLFRRWLVEHCPRDAENEAQIYQHQPLCSELLWTLWLHPNGQRSIAVLDASYSEFGGEASDCLRGYWIYLSPEIGAKVADFLDEIELHVDSVGAGAIYSVGFCYTRKHPAFGRFFWGNQLPNSYFDPQSEDGKVRLHFDQLWSLLNNYAPSLDCWAEIKPILRNRRSHRLTKGELKRQIVSEEDKSAFWKSLPVCIWGGAVPISSESYDRIEVLEKFGARAYFAKHTASWIDFASSLRGWDPYLTVSVLFVRRGTESDGSALTQAILFFVEQVVSVNGQQFFQVCFLVNSRMAEFYLSGNEYKFIPEDRFVVMRGEESIPGSGLVSIEFIEFSVDGEATKRILEFDLNVPGPNGFHIGSATTLDAAKRKWLNTTLEIC